MKASVIIPAYNEGLTIKEVILACKACSLVDEVIVVDDGSEDDTTIQAVAAGAQVLSYGENKGKAYAVLHGVKVAKNLVILLLDADLIGCTSLHVESLIRPVLMQKSQATVGLFTKGRMKTDLAHTLAPGLSGQRCMKKEMLISMKNCEDARYAFEIHLNDWMKKNNVSVMKVALEYVSHLTKEEKRGRKKGFSNRMEMYEDIVSRFFKK